MAHGDPDRFDPVTAPDPIRARLDEALADALLSKLGERGLNWEPSIDVARWLLADPKVAAALSTPARTTRDEEQR